MANNNVPPIQIMTLNVGGPGAAQEKRDHIRDRFQTRLRQCSVIFVQECNGRDRDNLMQILGQDYQISPDNGNSDVAIIWQRNMFRHVGVVDDVNIMYEINGNRLFRQMIHQDYFPNNQNNRVKVIRATLEPTGRVVFFASWHGPHNGFTNEHKADTARDLIRLMRNISGIQPFIVGGDFNLQADDEFPAVENRVEVRHIPYPYQTYRTMPNIDYFVLGNRGVFDVRGVTRLVRGNREILDHKPVQATFEMV
uniref:Endonuclease/exonuclease/phosphatase domain-containing protein n=1 Tax=Clytia hemisphaerica TaxID=252671 RepID=A0A7M5XLB1_9CNID